MQLDDQHDNGAAALGAQHGADHKLGVAISTTAGFYPTEGYDEVPLTQKVEVLLSKAANKLGIANTNGWIANVTEPQGKRTIVVANTYAENRLSGEVTIDWGPTEGGGGASARG